MHPGHLRLFRHAKELADTLVVAIQSDQIAGDLAILDENTRLEGVASNDFVDHSFIYRESISDLIQTVQPDIMLKGGEFKHLRNPEQDILSQIGAELIFHDGANWHVSENRLLTSSPASKLTIDLSKGFMARHGIDASALVTHVMGFSTKNVCVIGDVIVDEYVSCNVAGVSREEPTIVVYPFDHSRFLGGAGIVAGHGSGLGADVTLISVVGNDEAADFVKDQATLQGTDPVLFVDSNRQTTLKQRYRASGKSLLKVSHLHTGSIAEELQENIFNAFREIAPSCDLLVLSDFNYGVLPHHLVDRLIKLAKDNGIIVAADSQISSQTGDVTRFKGVDLITPTEHEARVALKANEASLIELAELFLRVSSAKQVFLSLGDEGVLILSGGEDARNWQADQLPALNLSAVDPAGAGDSMLVSSALAHTTGASIWEAALIGSITAGIQVGRVGNEPITADELVREMST